MTSQWVIIPASGIGARFSQELPKQYLKLHGKTVLEHTVALFLENHHFNKVVIAIAEHDVYFNDLPLARNPRIQVVVGGKTRAESVFNAMVCLKETAHSKDWVLVHDAVRPCLHPDDLANLIESLQEEEVGGILATPVSDTLKLGESNVISHTVSRANIWQALTPQMFRFQKLFEALLVCKEKGVTVTDEASALEMISLNPKLVNANFANPKLTFEKDLKLIAFLLEQLHQKEAC